MPWVPVQIRKAGQTTSRSGDPMEHWSTLQLLDNFVGILEDGRTVLKDPGDSILSTGGSRSIYSSRFPRESGYI